MSTALPDTFLSVFTYNRPNELARLLDALNEDPDAGRVNLSVIDDGSDPSYMHTFTQHWKGAGRIKCHGRNRGKKMFWQLWHFELTSARLAWKASGKQMKYFIFMADDFIPVPGFIGRLIQEWESIDDPKKGALSYVYVQQMRGKSNWTRVLPQQVGENLHLTQWVDGAFICGIELMEALKWQMDRITLDRWRGNPNLGSGVGQQISFRARNANLNLYHLHRSLIHVQDCVSQMNPNIRPHHPLTP